MKNKLKLLSVASVFFVVLSACGWIGGSGSGGGSQIITKSFSVSLLSAQVVRISSGGLVGVSTNGITSSGLVAVNP